MMKSNTPFAEQKLKLIAEHFKFSIDTDQTIDKYKKGKKSLVNKLQNLINKSNSREVSATSRRAACQWLTIPALSCHYGQQGSCVFVNL